MHCCVGLNSTPPAATAFVRLDVVRPAPRFSSFYLRLPEESLSAEDQQIAANFVVLGDPEELVRPATPLHRYAGSKALR